MIIFSNNNTDLVIDPDDRAKTNARLTLHAVADALFLAVLNTKFIILI